MIRATILSMWNACSRSFIFGSIHGRKATPRHLCSVSIHKPHLRASEVAFKEIVLFLFIKTISSVLVEKVFTNN